MIPDAKLPVAGIGAADRFAAPVPASFQVQSRTGSTSCVFTMSGTPGELESLKPPRETRHK